ncbi:hypothetical protein B194_0682 [Serratia plymuthica A30]|nr:hypothetical protein B194_0682 [Serratia plymuthica A30]
MVRLFSKYLFTIMVSFPYIIYSHNFCCENALYNEKIRNHMF